MVRSGAGLDGGADSMANRLLLSNRNQSKNRTIGVDGEPIDAVLTGSESW